ncbi:DUF2779 domain-containing protein [Sphingomonas corticis]|jgi:CRISPR/Cas system-associated exonuclease Cas4 (RecB family)|uniref:DUF2779 domain-containing protein n=1 Tax=Sphingomonas corticis TaxID=2722791 RepID=A0ABX1CVQ3_9SPHN|nr:DUF2779 domain-containing protein [Sphingomonas corticis]NJR80365.1 DUF2779 domain-containing protein [Sphingomonas corticis]
MRRHGLSKSKLTSYAQCPKRLWLQVHRPDVAQYDDGAEARFAAGHAIGDEACRQCSARHDGRGVMVEAEPTLATALATTAALLAAGHDAPIYEATFEHDGVLVRCDVLEPDGAGGWHMAEVKSSTRAKDYHRADLATQLWVARANGLPVSYAAVRHVDTSFVLEREGELDGLFADADLTHDLADELAAVPELVAGARATLAAAEPAAVPGDQCHAPFACEFDAYCRAALPPGPEWPVEVLPNGAGKKWRAAGIADVFAVEAGQLKGNARRVHAATVSGAPDHDAAGARAAMADWAFPRTWLDFETIAHVIPRWIGTRPYEQVPFQFTAIVEDGRGGDTLHEYLSLDGTDPRRACAEALCRLPREGAVIAYNASFERGVIDKLAAAFPDLAPVLESLSARLVDLLPVTRNHWYHRDQRGSWSIKAVLPTIAPHMDYAMLEVKHGGEAQEAWAEAAADGCTPDRRAALDAALRAYCGQDVEAMRVVARALVKTLNNEGA